MRTSAVLSKILMVCDIGSYHTIHIPAEAGGKLQAQRCKQAYGE